METNSLLGAFINNLISDLMNMTPVRPIIPEIIIVNKEKKRINLLLIFN